MTEDLRTKSKTAILAVKDLPTLPKVLDEVSALVADPNSSTEQIAKVISYDQVLSAKVLKMVNSPIYGFPGRIGSIQHALVLLGFNVIRGLIISTSVFDIMSTSMVGMWEHSVGCALASSEVAKAVGLDEPEEYSVAGLLHDLGKVVTAVQMPTEKKQMESLVQEQDMTYLDAEKEILGIGHDRINLWLAGHWNLPVKIKEGMAYHHAPTRAEHYPAVPCVVHVADFLVRLYEYGSGGDDNVPYLDSQALALLKIDTRTLDRLMETLMGKFMDVSDLQLG